MVLEFLAPFLKVNGLWSLFLTSFFGSTIFLPGVSEYLLLPLLKVGLNPVELILVASFGSLFGNLFNYALGFFSSNYVQRKFKKEIKKAHKLLHKYEWSGLFALMALPLPLPTDAITVIAGIGKMRLDLFVSAVLLSKIVKYSIYVIIFNFIV